VKLCLPEAPLWNPEDAIQLIGVQSGHYADVNQLKATQIHYVKEIMKALS